MMEIAKAGELEFQNICSQVMLQRKKIASATCQARADSANLADCGENTEMGLGRDKVNIHSYLCHIIFLLLG